ncbi:MAG: hypothetical protein ABSH39_13750 [Candidatus Acidiferrum sp.]|jgi:hypothetical protein
MNRNVAEKIIFAACLLVLMVCVCKEAQSQSIIKTNYPKMAPLEQYLMERNAEIALARSAAPPAISKDAEVLVLGQHSYESAVKGTNGFVCMVQRSWTVDANHPDFWNPKLRSPTCFNAPAVRSNLPIILRRTELILEGKSKEQMFESIRSAFDKKELPLPEPDSMCYMMSSQGYLNDEAAGPWLPHVMIFVPLIDPKAWGANNPGSPIFAFQDVDNHFTVFMIPVSKWSDGTLAPTK